MQNKPQLLSEEDWSEWLDHPVTKVFRQALATERQSIMDQWAEGAFTAETESGTLVLAAQAFGSCKTFKRILELNHEVVNGVFDDE